jgi:hypothetical protein
MSKKIRVFFRPRKAIIFQPVREILNTCGKAGYEGAEKGATPVPEVTIPPPAQYLYHAGTVPVLCQYHAGTMPAQYRYHAGTVRLGKGRERKERVYGREV